MHKLFFDVPEGSDEITVSGDDFAHLTVLRIKKGDTVEISDGQSKCYTAVAESFSKKGATFSLSAPRPFSSESDIRITAIVPFLKAEKMISLYRNPLNSELMISCFFKVKIV